MGTGRSRERSLLYIVFQKEISLKSEGCMASSFSTYDFSTLFTTFNPSKEKLTEFIEPFNIDSLNPLI